MKKYIISLISLIISVSCIVLFNIIGSEVAPDGMLVEPFFLIPLFYVFLAISIISFIVSFVLKLKKAH